MNKKQFNTMHEKYKTSNSSVSREFFWALCDTVLQSVVPHQVMMKRQEEIYQCLSLSPIHISKLTIGQEHAVLSQFDTERMQKDYETEYETFYAAILWYSVNVSNKQNAVNERGRHNTIDWILAGR